MIDPIFVKFDPLAMVTRGLVGLDASDPETSNGPAQVSHGFIWGPIWARYHLDAVTNWSLCHADAASTWTECHSDAVTNWEESES